jgi:hypothetical protein
LLLNSPQVIPKSQPNEGVPSLRRKIEELNRNAVVLIAEVGKLIKGSEQLSHRLKAFEGLSTKRTQVSINPSP